MTIATYGVTAAVIQTDYFSQGASFSAESNPSSTSVARYIQQRGAELGALLRKESQDPAAIELLTTDECYLWCQETLCLMVACRIAEDMLQARPPLADTWEKRLAARLEALAEDAEGTLGSGAASPTLEPDGPTHWIDERSLDTSDNDDDASEITAPLRKDDVL